MRHVSGVESFYGGEGSGLASLCREKMAVMGVKQWGGVDVQVFQETCGGMGSHLW